MLLGSGWQVNPLRPIGHNYSDAQIGRSGANLVENVAVQIIRHLCISNSRRLGSIDPAPLVLFSAVMFFAWTTASSISAAPVVEGKDRASSVTQIHAVLGAQQEVWNRGDIDGFMNGYARSRSTTFVSEDTVRRGWETVRDRYRKKYSDRAKMGVLTFSNLEITPLASDVAVVLGRWKLKRAQDEPHGRFTLIFRCLPEGWRIVHDHTSAAPPPS